MANFQEIVRFFGGLRTSGDPSYYKNECQTVLNYFFDEDGRATVAKGYELVGDDLGDGKINGLAYFILADGTEYLVCSHLDKIYYLDTTNNTWTALATTYGVAVNGVYPDVGFQVIENVLLFGNGTDGVRKWTGTGDHTSVASVEANMFRFASVGAGQRRNFTAGDSSLPSTVEYSAVDDTDNFSGGDTILINTDDGQKITYLAITNDSSFPVIVLKENSCYRMGFELDSVNTLYVAGYRPMFDRYGCVGFKAATNSPNDIYFASKRGLRTVGQQENFSTTLRQEGFSKPIMEDYLNINWEYKEKIALADFDGKIWMALPYGEADTNNFIFVYDYENVVNHPDGQYGTWSILDIAANCFTINTGLTKEEMYFGSPTQGKVYKFNDSYSRNDNSYTRTIKSRRIESDSKGNHRNSIKHLQKLVIEGWMQETASCTLTIHHDDSTTEITFTDSTIVGSGFQSGIIVGSTPVGAIGDGTSDSTFQRFKLFITFEGTQPSGRAFDFEFTNTAKAQAVEPLVVTANFEVESIESQPSNLVLIAPTET